MQHIDNADTVKKVFIWCFIVEPHCVLYSNEHCFLSLQLGVNHKSQHYIYDGIVATFVFAPVCCCSFMIMFN